MKRSLRFCMISTFYPPYSYGGDGIFVYHLSNALARLGNSVDVIHCLDSYHALGGKVCENPYPNHPNVTVHSLKSPYGFLSPLATQQTGHPFFKAARIKAILNNGFDVIHYHNISLVGGPAVVKLGQGIKLYTTHEYWLVCPMHLLFRFNKSECTRRYCLPCSLSYRRIPQLWRYSGLLKQIEKHIDMFIAPSHFCVKKHREMGFNAPMAHIPNFVPLPDGTFSNILQNTPSEERRPYFLYVGRLEKIKGLQTIIPLFQRYPKAELRIVGKGNYESDLKKLAKGSSNIRFLGYQHGQALGKLYQKAIAVIIPSICFEISSLVIPEAFTHHTPVIAKKRGGMPETIEKSGAGILFEDEFDLMRAMNALIEKPALRHDLGECGHRAYLRNWSAQAYLKKYFELIENISNERSKDGFNQSEESL